MLWLDADQCLAIDSARSQKSGMGVNSQSGQVVCSLFHTVNYSAASQEQALFFQVLLFGEIWRDKAKEAALQKEIHTLNIRFFFLFGRCTLNTALQMLGGLVLNQDKTVETDFPETIKSPCVTVSSLRWSLGWEGLSCNCRGCRIDVSLLSVSQSYRPLSVWLRLRPDYLWVPVKRGLEILQHFCFPGTLHSKCAAVNGVLDR